MDKRGSLRRIQDVLTTASPGMSLPVSKFAVVPKKRSAHDIWALRPVSVSTVCAHTPPFLTLERPAAIRRRPQTRPQFHRSLKYNRQRHKSPAGRAGWVARPARATIAIVDLAEPNHIMSGLGCMAHTHTTSSPIPPTTSVPFGRGPLFVGTFQLRLGLAVVFLDLSMGVLEIR